MNTRHLRNQKVYEARFYHHAQVERLSYILRLHRLTKQNQKVLNAETKFDNVEAAKIKLPKRKKKSVRFMTPAKLIEPIPEDPTAEGEMSHDDHSLHEIDSN